MATNKKENFTMEKKKKRAIILEVDDEFLNKLLRLISEEYDVKSIKMKEIVEEPKQPVRVGRTESLIENYNTNTNYDIEKHISEILFQIGIPAHILGYQYLRYAIKLAITDITLVSSITKQMYPYIAEHFNTTPSRVERAIRHAIEIAWDRGNTEVLDNIFGFSVNSQKGKATNSEFIAMIADRLRLKLKMKDYA